MMTTPSTISYRRGDIVLVSFPFTDLTFAKRRPALVVSPDIFNELNQDLILLAVTSQLNSFPYSISVLPSDCDHRVPEIVPSAVSSSRPTRRRTLKIVTKEGES
jgi:mRNA interferase MazF